MKLTHETLAVVTRPSLVSPGESEVLSGLKRRGFKGDAFPGGKLDGTEDRAAGISREVAEETGIHIPADQFEHIGDITVLDNRPESKRFGQIGLYLGQVAAGTKAETTDELVTSWKNIKDPELTASMHPDVQVWWPYVVTGMLPLKIIVEYDADAALHVTVKEPDALRLGIGGHIYEQRVI